MKKIITTIFSVLFKPKEFFQHLLKHKVESSFLLIYMILLNLIGPTLSFYSMHFIEHISISRSLLYAIVTYFLDIICIFIFAYFVNFLEGEKNFYLFLEITIFVYTPIWLSDIVDLNQYLRPLSNLGLLYSLALIFVAFSNIGIKRRNIFLYIFAFLILYVLDAFFAEMIVQNPWVKMLIK